MEDTLRQTLATVQRTLTEWQVLTCLLQIVAALTLADHFCPPSPTYDRAHLYPYVYLSAQPCSALTFLVPNTSTRHKNVNIRPTQ